jgi:phage tail-like protein
MLSEQNHWRFESVEGLPPAAQYDPERRVLRLASERPESDWAASETEALKLLDSVPQAFDPWGSRAFWSTINGKVMATGAVPGNVPLFTPAPGDSVTDLALGYDQVLYIATGGHVVLLDPRGRFSPFTVPDTPNFQAWRLAADPKGGVWALDRTNLKIGRVRGLPLIARPHPEYAPGTFRPLQENISPPRLDIEAALNWPQSETPVAIAAGPEGQLALLTWTKSEFAQLRVWDSGGKLSTVTALAGARTPYSLAFVSSKLIAIMLPGISEAPVYPVDEGAAKTPPLGNIYPLRQHTSVTGDDAGPFLHGLDLPPQYPMHGGGSAPLCPLSLPSYARKGEVLNATAMDSGNPFSVWHRLYLEAAIPDHCSVTVGVAAVNDPGEAVSDDAWQPHQFGQISDTDAPRGAWVPSASEVPFHPGLLQCKRRKDRAGLFTVLLQRSNRKVRALRGRYLKVRLKLQGNGRSTPEVAALRAYVSRFSYVDHYLPELYREDQFGPDGDQPGTSTGADFLERFLDNFEGILTPLEDKIASSYLVTTAENTPAAALDWLGSWIGMGFDQAYTESQRRDFIRSAPDLFRRRGTIAGLSLALDIATGGAVSRHQILLLEDYRLRRTFATILGADLSDANDPLLEGIGNSGNSFVGDTLFLGDELNREFLELYRDNLPKTRSERAALEALYDGFANRLTVLVHQEIDPQDLGLVRRVVDLETPAHVSVTVKTATNEFLAGVSSLIEVDTYLAKKRKPGTVRINSSYLGNGDLIQREPALDPRLDGANAAIDQPIAILGSPGQVGLGQSFQLDGSKSQSFGSTKLVNYIWTRIN